ncbi:MAG: alpha-galactosidase, partial [Pseudomonadota bacterium]
QPTHQGVITLRSSLRCDADIRLIWLSVPALPLPYAAQTRLDFDGYWCRELQENKAAIAPGVYMRESRSGRHGHDKFPGLVLSTHAATNTRGQVWGMHYAWSGGTRIIAEAGICRQVQAGHASGCEQGFGREFATAEAIIAYGNRGINALACQYQDYARAIMPAAACLPRRVHYNCWEAIYFDHDEAILQDLASRAHNLGAERFVLDDGWFVGRNDDSCALGDWQIDAKKYPNGLTPLIAHVKKLGMDFGLWVEPEMISEKSALYRTHPNWILGRPTQPLWRNQYVLDMSLSAVQDYVITALCNILAQYDIACLKWDHNRALPVNDAEQTRGLYHVLAEINRRFPDLEIETCASGGGRMDYGMLQFCTRVWLSDSNDALVRWQMQQNAAIFMPGCMTGSHVGPRICHTTARSFPMAFRVWVAATRHMGFEMDLRELDAHETDVLRATTAWWKEGRAWRMQANILMIDIMDDACIGELHMHPSGGKFVVFIGLLDTPSTTNIPPIALPGLDVNAAYELTMITKDNVPKHSSGDNAFKHGKLKASGFALSHHGVQIPLMHPASMMVFEGVRL